MGNPPRELSPLNSWLRTIGRVLLLGLPTCLLFASLYIAFAPRQYRSTCILEVEGGYPAIAPHFQIAAASYRNDAALYSLRQSTLCGIDVYDADPRRAAEKANQLGATVQDKINRANLGDAFTSSGPILIQSETRLGKPAGIWGKAEPAYSPARRDIVDILFRSAFYGFSSAFLGLLVLFIRWLLPTQPSLRPTGQ